MTDPLTSIQYLSIILATIASVAIAWRLHYNHFVKFFDQPKLIWSITWTLHVIIFYISVGLSHAGWFDLPHSNFWSSVLRLHGIVTFLCINLVDVYYTNKGRKQK